MNKVYQFASRAPSLLVLLAAYSLFSKQICQIKQNVVLNMHWVSNNIIFFENIQMYAQRVENLHAVLESQFARNG